MRTKCNVSKGFKSLTTPLAPVHTLIKWGILAYISIFLSFGGFMLHETRKTTTETTIKKEPIEGNPSIVCEPLVAIKGGSDSKIFASVYPVSMVDTYGPQIEVGGLNINVSPEQCLKSIPVNGGQCQAVMDDLFSSI